MIAASCSIYESICFRIAAINIGMSTERLTTQQQWWLKGPLTNQYITIKYLIPLWTSLWRDVKERNSNRKDWFVLNLTSTMYVPHSHSTSLYHSGTSLHKEPASDLVKICQGQAKWQEIIRPHCRHHLHCTKLLPA